MSQLTLASDINTLFIPTTFGGEKGMFLEIKKGQ
jgi:hypothetical protein